MSRRVGFIHPTAIIGEPAESRDATTDAGWYVHEDATIEALASVDSGTITMTRIDADAWIFKHAHIGHDAHIMEGAEVSTGVVVGGHAIIGPHAKIGLNATILPWRTIGRRARIGAGAVVTKDVPPGEIWAGNPARKMRDKSTSAPLAETLPHAERSEASWRNVRRIHDEVMERSSSAPEPITQPTPSPQDTSTSPATVSANSAPATPLSATDADAAWWAWVASRATSAKPTTLPSQRPAASTGASAPPAPKLVPSRLAGECLDCWKTDPSHLLCGTCPALGFYE